MRRHYFWRPLFMVLLIVFVVERVLNFGAFLSKTAIPILLVIWGISVLSRGSRYREGYSNQQQGGNFENSYRDENKNDFGSNNSNDYKHNYSDVDKYNNYQSGEQRNNYESSSTGQNYNSYNSGSGYYDSYKKDIIFSHSQITATGSEKKFSVVFSDGRIDLSCIPMPIDNRMIKIDVVFSNGVIKVNEDIPAVIRAKGVFSGVRLPDNSNIAFGEHTYVTKSYRDGAPHFYIEINSVFSSTVISDKMQ